MAKLPSTEFLKFVAEIKVQIQQARLNALKVVNQQAIELNWSIGKLIVERQKQHGWGKSIVEKLSKELKKEFPNTQGYSAGNLWRMRHFYLSYQSNKNLAPMVREIGWSHNIII